MCAQQTALPISAMIMMTGKTIHFDLTNVINSYHSTSSNYTEMTLVFSGVGEQDQEKRVEIDDIKVVYIKTA